MDNLKVNIPLERTSALGGAVSQEAASTLTPALSWNIANQITILRVLLAPVYIIMLLYGFIVPALVIFFALGASDAVDGFVARRTGQVTFLGTILDPLADKLILIASFLSLSFLGLIPAWLTIVVVSRDILIVTGSLVLKVFSGSVAVTPSLLGKWTTGLQLLTVFWVLWFNFLETRPPLMAPLLGLTVAATLASGLHYVYRVMRRSADTP